MSLKEGLPEDLIQMLENSQSDIVATGGPSVMPIIIHKFKDAFDVCIANGLRY